VTRSGGARGTTRIAAAIAALVTSTAAPAHAEPAGSGREIDRVVVRFFSPETGGSAQPRFVTERTLAFEARLEAMAERPDGTGEGYDDRRIRAALDHHLVEDILASLALKLTTGARPSVELSAAPLAALRDDLSAALFERLGGRERVEAAASAEQIDAGELDDLFRRQALAAWYLDRVVTPILHPTDEQLREVFRTAAHPYRGRPFDQVRAPLGRWFVAERLRVAESAFLQAARARLKIVVTSRD
jgi:hypothetical protein